MNLTLNFDDLLSDCETIINYYQQINHRKIPTVNQLQSEIYTLQSTIESLSSPSPNLPIRKGQSKSSGCTPTPNPTPTPSPNRKRAQMRSRSLNTVRHGVEKVKKGD